jgi:hypothetical protein
MPKTLKRRWQRASCSAAEEQATSEESVLKSNFSFMPMFKIFAFITMLDSFC